MTDTHSVLFLCLGNIVRSTMSEIIMNYLVNKHGVAGKWVIDSAGTSNYHIGEGPDHRTIDVCRRRLGKDCPPITHKARQLISGDFTKFDYILYMDTSNGHNLRYMEPKGDYKAHVALLGSFDPEKVKDEATVVEDPYYDSNLDGFEFNFDLITRCCEALIERVHG